MFLLKKQTACHIISIYQKNNHKAGQNLQTCAVSSGSETSKSRREQKREFDFLPKKLYHITLFLGKDEVKFSLHCGANKKDEQRVEV